MRYLGDFPEDGEVVFLWSTNDSDGASITRSTDGSIRVYRDGELTEIGGGSPEIEDTEDFDSLTGIHRCRIDLSASSFFQAGSEYDVVLQGSTIDTQSVNAVLAHFSIERPGGVLALLKGANGLDALAATLDSVKDDTDYNLPTQIAGVESKVDTVDGIVDSILEDTGTTLPGTLSTIAGYIDTEITELLVLGQSIKDDTDYNLPTQIAGVQSTADAIEADTQNIQSRLPAALVGGRIDASVGAMAANSITAAATAADYLAEINAEVDTALADYDAPTFAELVSEINDVQADIAALNDPTAAAIFTAVLTTQLTESYAGQGVAPTLAQAIFAMHQYQQEVSISGTTMTVEQLDGTTAYTLTLNDGTNPTSKVRTP